MSIHQPPEPPLPTSLDPILSTLPQVLLTGLISSDRIPLLKRELEMVKLVKGLRRKKKESGVMPVFVDFNSLGMGSYQRLQVYKIAELFGLGGSGEGTGVRNVIRLTTGKRTRAPKRLMIDYKIEEVRGEIERRERMGMAEGNMQGGENAGEEGGRGGLKVTAGVSNNCPQLQSPQPPTAMMQTLMIKKNDAGKDGKGDFKGEVDAGGEVWNGAAKLFRTSSSAEEREVRYAEARARIVGDGREEGGQDLHGPSIYQSPHCTSRGVPGAGRAGKSI